LVKKKWYHDEITIVLLAILLDMQNEDMIAHYLNRNICGIICRLFMI